MFLKTKYKFKTFLSEEEVYARLKESVDSRFSVGAQKPFYGWVRKKEFRLSPTLWFLRRSLSLTCRGKFYKNDFPLQTNVELNFLNYIVMIIIYLLIVLVFAITLYLNVTNSLNVIILNGALLLIIYFFSVARAFQLISRLKKLLELFE